MCINFCATYFPYGDVVATFVSGWTGLISQIDFQNMKLSNILGDFFTLTHIMRACCGPIYEIISSFEFHFLHCFMSAWLHLLLHVTLINRTIFFFYILISSLLKRNSKIIITCCTTFGGLLLQTTKNFLYFYRL